jgi:hypothetical protein
MPEAERSPATGPERRESVRRVQVGEGLKRAAGREERGNGTSGFFFYFRFTRKLLDTLFPGSDPEHP